MPGILEDPQVVRDALAAFHDLVANDCPRRHGAEDLTGRFGVDRKTVRGIHREFAPTTDPSGLFINSVGTRGKHYPLEFRRFPPKGLGARLGDPFEDHTTRFGQVVDGAGAEPIPGAFPFNRSFTHASVLNPILGQLVPPGEPRADIGDRTFHHKPEWKGRSLKASAVAAEIPAADRKVVPIGARRPGSFPGPVRIPQVNPKVRMGILGKEQTDPEPCKILVTNRVTGEVRRIRRVDRHRGTGPEPFHRDGQHPLGRGDGPRRDVPGQTRPMDLVLLASSLLMQHLGQGPAAEWALPKRTTIGEAGRAMLRESLRTTLTGAMTPVTERAWSVDQGTTHRGLAGAP